MLRIRFSFILVLACALLAGCSGSGESTGGSASSTVTENLGTSTREHIVQTSEDALVRRYGYLMERRVDSSEDIRYETQWKQLPATRDEQAQGYAFARVRITITARPRSRSGGGARTYSARLVAECQVQPTAGGGDWMNTSLTAERKVYIDEIVDYLENEFKAGVR